MRGKPNLPRLAKAAAWLAEHYPTPYPVTVSLVKGLRDHHTGEPLWGSAYCKGKRMFIELKPGAFATMVETLAHEWAHLVHAPYHRQERRRDLREHDPLTGWGNTYASIYSDLFDHPERCKI